AVTRLRQADELEELGAFGRAALRACESLVEDEQLVGAHPAGKAEELREVAERAACRRRPCRRAADLGRSFARPHEPAGDLDQRRLAGAVRPQQADQLALG